MSFSGDVENFLESIGPFYEFVNLQGDDMLPIKEKIDEAISTASSASSATSSVLSSLENSPVKSPLALTSSSLEATEEDPIKLTVTAETQSATYEDLSKQHSFSNGHISNSLSTSAGFVPPPTPIHKHSNEYLNNNNTEKFNHNRNQKNPSPSYSANYQGLNGLTGDPEDEMLTISTANGKQTVEKKISADTIGTSGTESDKYYSGESESEQDEVMPLSKKSQTEKMVRFETATTRKKMKPIMVRAATFSGAMDPNMVVDATVERLNRDVDHILARLRILEAAYANERCNHDGNPGASVAHHKRPVGLRDLSRSTLAIFVMWPFVAHFIIKLVKWWWLRKRSLLR